MTLPISERGRRMPASPIRKLMPLADEARRRGVRVYHLNIGQPDLETPPAMRAKLANAPAIYAYTPSAGTAECLATLREYYRRLGVELQADQIIATTGGSEAILFALTACANEGDEALIVEPFYTNYIAFATMAGVRLVPLRARGEDGFHLPPVAEWEKARTPRTRLVILCNPNNPTGTVYRRDELETLAAFCREHGLFLVADEVYREFVYDGLGATSVLSLPGCEEIAVVVDSLSKRYSACGIRLGCLATRNRDVYTARSAHGAGPALAARPRPARGPRGDRARPGLRPGHRPRVPGPPRRAPPRASREIPGVFLRKPEGAFYFVARLPIEDGEDFASWLLTDFSFEGATVMVAPRPGLLRDRGPRPGRGADRLRPQEGGPRGLGPDPGEGAARLPRGAPARAGRDGGGGPLRRIAAWGLVPGAALAALGAWLALTAHAAVLRGRERLLAGDAAGAEAAFTRALRWPPDARRAQAGLALARALRGEPPPVVTAAAELLRFEPPALVEAAIGRGDLAAGAALADLARQAGHPLGPLYAAAIAFERGDEATARRLASSSPAPLACRRVGRALQQALEERDRGAAAFVRDRNGELVGTLDAGGRFALVEGLDPRLVPPLQVPRAPLPSAGVRLTLDLDLARLAQEALGPRRGTIVLVEPRTGAILAAVTDPRTAAREGAAAFAQRRAPASIAKLLTTAAAYRAGLDADAAIARMTCAGVERYGGKPLWCAWPAGRLSGLDQALAVSCNIAFANLAMRLGREALVAEYRRWGFDAPPGALLGGAGRIRRLPRTPRELASLAIGLDLAEITPLHAALMAAVIGNGGAMPEPRLVAGSCSPLGLVDQPQRLPPARPVAPPATARRLLRAMAAVAEHGTGAGLSPAGLPVAMKTGTGAEPGLGYHVNYVGVAPAADAAIAFAVRVTGEPTSRRVTRAAHEVTARLLAGLADRRGALDGAARRQRAASGPGRGDDHEVGRQLAGPAAQGR